MSRTNDGSCLRSVRGVWRLAMAALALIVVAAGSVRGITTYSGASVSSSGTINGWGVTDAYVSGMHHDAYVSTTLKSPKNRTSSSGWRHATTTVRADVSLPWDGTDLGAYVETSSHKFYCYAVLAFLYLSGTSDSTPAPYVAMQLRNTFGTTVSDDDAGRVGYYAYNGTYALGTIQNYNNSFWETGVEIVGTVYPSTYTGTITLHRQIVSLREYYNTTTATMSWPPCDAAHPNCDDSSDGPSRDDNPQSGGSAGRVYDTDSPGLPPLATENTYDRLRVNFREYATASGVSVPVSDDFNWWSRLSVYRPTGQVTTILKNDVPGDNVSGILSTRISWDLQ